MEQQSDVLEVYDFISSEILQLNFKRAIVRKAVKKFDITIEEATTCYTSVKSQIGKEALRRAYIYLLLGGISLFVGISGTLGTSRFIFWGALLVGSGMTITSLGLFKVYFTRN